MKYTAATIAALLCGLSFAAGVKHGKGELIPLIDARLRQFIAWVKTKLHLK